MRSILELSAMTIYFISISIMFAHNIIIRNYYLISPPHKTLNILPIDYVLLPTAIIYFRNRIGAFMHCRAILNSASQLNVITSRLACQLNLNHRRSQTSISGIGESSMMCRYSCAITGCKLSCGIHSGCDSQHY